MSGTRTLHAVVGYALRCGADVRLVGDDKQLGAVMIPISPEAAGIAVTGLLNLSRFCCTCWPRSEVRRATPTSNNILRALSLRLPE